MSDDGSTGPLGEPKAVNWPADLLAEPDYPRLEEKTIDLACDAIVFRAPFDPEKF